jgi:hypothetical protein
MQCEMVWFLFTRESVEGSGNVIEAARCSERCVRALCLCRDRQEWQFSVQYLCCRKESVWIPVSVSLSVSVCLFTLSPSLFGESGIALCSICTSARSIGKRTARWDWDTGLGSWLQTGLCKLLQLPCIGGIYYVGGIE